MSWTTEVASNLQQLVMWYVAAAECLLVRIKAFNFCLFDFFATQRQHTVRSIVTLCQHTVRSIVTQCQHTVRSIVTLCQLFPIMRWMHLIHIHGKFYATAFSHVSLTCGITLETMQDILLLQTINRKSYILVIYALSILYRFAPLLMTMSSV